MQKGKPLTQLLPPVPVNILFNDFALNTESIIGDPGDLILSEGIERAIRGNVRFANELSAAIKNYLHANITTRTPQQKHALINFIKKNGYCNKPGRYGTICGPVIIETTNPGIETRIYFEEEYCPVEIAYQDKMLYRKEL